VSDFRLDVHEITLGRFRAFLEAGEGTQADPPVSGSGAHPKHPGSGWDPAWNDYLTVNKAAFKSALTCGGWGWSETSGSFDDRPMTCITWFEAFAFCAWDGGRLPTDAEWGYAALGGDEQRQYPWGSSSDETKASYNCLGDGAPECTKYDLLPVGSKSPAGDGRWGQADMAGNATEVVFDWWALAPEFTCNDCLDWVSGTYRVNRGTHAWDQDASVFGRRSVDPAVREPMYGFRCARLP
jgi:formylglycine-generating enzyme required for sulfatase activity